MQKKYPKNQNAWDFAPSEDELGSIAIADSREYQRNLMASKRAAERDLQIPAPADLARRERYRDDPKGFMVEYLDHLFTNPFTADHELIIKSLLEVLHYGGCQSIAIPRGEGKSTLTIAFCVWAVVYGHAKYIVIVGANATESKKKLDNFKAIFEKKKYAKLAADFPEICICVRDVAGAPQKGRSQTANGEPTNIEWSAGELTFPDVAGSDAAEAKLSIVGIDGAIRGLVDDGKRPDIVIIDDCETKGSARSTVETEARRESIEKDILGLGGSGQRLGVILLCTIIRPGCIADEFTDREKRPDWMGIRRKFVLSWPEKEEMWAKYMEMRIRDQVAGDRFGRTAHKFYLDNRAEMDTGGEVSNPNRYVKIVLPDGTRVEESAIQHAYNELLRKKEHGFNSELQNSPSELTAETLNINEASVCNKLSHIPRGQVPAWAEYITVGCDVAGRSLHWVATAWKSGKIGAIIDYGIEQVHSPAGATTSSRNLRHTQAAILQALITLADSLDETGWIVLDTGEVKRLDLMLVDSGSGDFQEPVYKFAKSRGSRFRPIKGYGANQPIGKFKMLSKRMSPARRGAHYYGSPQKEARILLWHLDADHYKNATHNGIATPEQMPGCISLFGSDAVSHREFARHITAEIWTREFTPGKGWKEHFEVVHHQNHWLDATSYSNAGFDMLKVGGILDEPSAVDEPSANNHQPPRIMARKKLTTEEMNRRRYG